MLKALYYPHTDINSSVILKNALLLWDNIETIVPSARWQPFPTKDSKLSRAAHELVVQHRVPTDTERQKAHQLISSMTASGFLARLVAESPRDLHGGGEYLIYGPKFHAQTWDMLQDFKMARWIPQERDYGVPAAVGFLMMSILADVCAGTQIRKVTDRTDAYSWLAKMRAKDLNSQYITDLDPSQVAPDYDRLTAISFKVMDGRDVPLEKLVEMRKREAKQGGSDYSAMRRRYVQTLEAHIERVGKEAKSESDVRELERQFENDIKQDVSDLRAELRVATSKLMSKDVVLPVLLLAGSFVAPIPGLIALATSVGGVLGTIPLFKAAIDYRAAKRDALRKHTMSWLYVAKQRRITSL